MKNHREKKLPETKTKINKQSVTPWRSYRPTQETASCMSAVTWWDLWTIDFLLSRCHFIRPGDYLLGSLQFPSRLRQSRSGLRAKTKAQIIAKFSPHWAFPCQVFIPHRHAFNLFSIFYFSETCLRVLKGSTCPFSLLVLCRSFKTWRLRFSFEASLVIFLRRSDVSMVTT